MDYKIKEKYIELLRSVCMIETPSNNKNNIDKMVDLIQNFAKDNGYITERYSFEKAGDFLLIRTDDNSSKKPVLLMAHMDTVHKEGSFGEQIVTRDGEWLYGPGVIDCKGGIAVGLAVMELLKSEKKSRRPVYFLLTSDEEIGGCLSGEKGLEIITNTAKACCAVLNLEPGMTGKITVGRKGILRMSATVSGVAGHAGNAYFDGASAVREAANMILEIESMSEKGGTTYNCGIVNGGTAANIIPEKCTIEVDIRVSTSDEMQLAKDKMFELAGKSVVPNTKRSVSVVSIRPPMEKTDKNIELLNLWNRSAKELGVGPFEGIVKGGGSDAAYTVLAGVPTLCSCAMVGFGEHTLGEKLDLSTFDERVALICNTIRLV